MARRVVVSLSMIAFLSLLIGGCQRKVVIEGEGKHQGVIMEDKAEAEDQLAREKEEIEASLKSKKYQGIEGEVFESSLLKDIHFPFDRYDLSPKSRQILGENAEFILKFPDAKIQIEGHCDERGTNEYNLALGERRAMSAKNYLVSIGVPAGRLSIISYGEELPVASGHSEEAWAKNRRGHFVVLSK
ncbi:MAG: peptidoglycan-associated lipoprotein Pal [Proteobacteria bacterium]|nr:peptidoglycan-associated lipoprotein Pal [Pseudomonadota bacterium]